MNIKVLVAISMCVLICGKSQAESGDPNKGKELSQVCAACHSVDGNSINPIWPKIAGQHESYIIKQLSDYKDGKRMNTQMAPMAANLSDQNMKDLAAYFSIQSVKPGTADPELIQNGETIYRAGDADNGIPACMACHGPAGKGNPGALYPAVSGQHAEYTAMQLKQFKAEQRNNDLNSVMRTIAAPMTNAQIEAVAEYIQGLR